MPLVSEKTYRRLRSELTSIAEDGLYKRERLISSPQSGEIRVALKGKSQPIINLCANNYLGLADHPEIIAAAKATMDAYGYGMASVRFICGTLDLHRELERVIADFLEMDDAILYAAAFDANGGVFEPLLTAEMPLFPIRSITLRSSTAFACARQSAIASKTTIWPTSK